MQRSAVYESAIVLARSKAKLGEVTVLTGKEIQLPNSRPYFNGGITIMGTEINILLSENQTSRVGE